MVRPPPPRAHQRHCERCFLPHALCICPWIPSLTPCCRVVVVRHRNESWRTTNTGRLVALALEGCEIMDHGHRDHRLEPGDVPTGPGVCLLYPRRDDDVPLWTGGRPEVLVVPDGTWSQARRIVRRVPGLATLPRLELPPAPPPVRRLRKSPSPEARCTIEAVAAALGKWGPPEHERALLDLYDLLAKRMDKGLNGTPAP